MISGMIVEQLITPFIDAGAAVTVVSERFFMEVLRANCTINRNGSIDSVKAADGSTVPVTGFISFPTTISNSAYLCDASIVPGLTYDVVLGRDFFHKFNAVIKIHNWRLTSPPPFLKSCNPTRLLLTQIVNPLFLLIWKNCPLNQL